MRRAFTLIELLVVIAIIAILAIVVILTLNPGQLLAQARDSSRLSDLSSLQSAIGYYQTDAALNGSLSLGTPNVTYLSIPDLSATSTAGSDCAGLGFPSGGSFHCAASSTFRNIDGTGWIPVKFSLMGNGSPIGQLPIDPLNTTSSNSFYTYQTDGTTYKLSSIPESQKYLAQAGANPNMFMSGTSLSLAGGSWVLVPGNSSFGTSNFYVMQYEAKCLQASNNTALTSPDTTYHTYSNSGQPCVGPTYSVASVPAGWAIANIKQSGDGSKNDAASYCATLGAHLITNAEWQTIAWNVEGISSNWKNGVIGSTEAGGGGLFRGNSNSSLAMDGSSPLSGTNTRTLTLSNGSVVWDLAGNVWEWNSDQILGKNQPTNGTPGFNWRAFSATDDGSGHGGITTWGTMTQQTAGPSNSTWNATNGIGRIYSDGTGTNNTNYGFLRGGSWSIGTSAGVETLDLNNGPGSTNIRQHWLPLCPLRIAFRPASRGVPSKINHLKI